MEEHAGSLKDLMETKGERRVYGLAWMIAHCAVMRGWTMRAPLRVMYADRIGDRQAHQGGRRSSELLGKDLAQLDLDGIIERAPGRVIVLDWPRLIELAAQA